MHVNINVKALVLQILNKKSLKSTAVRNPQICIFIPCYQLEKEVSNSTYPCLACVLYCISRRNCLSLGALQDRVELSQGRFKSIEADTELHLLPSLA